MPIEVEKKFLLTPADEANLIRWADFVNERTITDVYYDTDDYCLTSRDWWLRARDGRFELKLPATAPGAKLEHDQYTELEDETEIKKALDLTTEENLAAVLSASGYRPFGMFQTTRRKYKKRGFTIDLDQVDFPGHAYRLGEIELMVEARSEIADALDRIIGFARSHSLRIAPVRGKVNEYLKRFRPEHYRALVQAGVVRDFD